MKREITNNMCDDDSSDDEMMIEALREATDQQFLKNSFFGDDESKKKSRDAELLKNPPEAKPSLRCNSDRPDNFHSFGVAQSYRDYVAKKLHEVLDRNIQEVKVKNKKIKTTKSDPGIGIRLLSTSDNCLPQSHEELITVYESPVMKKFNKPEESTAERKLKCQEAAVDPEFILSKIETKTWNERQRGTVYKYKKSPNGTLVEQQ